jgi:hypothetical protein
LETLAHEIAGADAMLDELELARRVAEAQIVSDAFDVHA